MRQARQERLATTLARLESEEREYLLQYEEARKKGEESANGNVLAGGDAAIRFWQRAQ